MRERVGVAAPRRPRRLASSIGSSSPVARFASSASAWRRENVLLLRVMSLLYSLFAVTGAVVLLLLDSPLSGLRSGATTASQALFFTVCAAFFVWDSLVVLTKQRKRKRLTARDMASVAHHVVCIVALLGAIVSNKDGTILLLATVLGELSSPPRFLGMVVAAIPPKSRGQDSGSENDEDAGSARRRLLGAPTDRSVTSVLPDAFVRWLSQPRTRRMLIDRFQLCHKVMFFCLRLASCHFLTHVVFGYGQLFTTKICGLSLIALSWAAIWDNVTRVRRHSGYSSAGSDLDGSQSSGGHSSGARGRAWR